MSKPTGNSLLSLPKTRESNIKETSQPTSLDKLGRCPNEMCTQQLTLALISRKHWLGLSTSVLFLRKVRFKL